MCADGKENGFLIDGKASVANLVRCEVRTCAQTGVSVSNGALATLERVLVEGSRAGDGVRVQGGGAQMQAKECRILRCQMHGVLACMGGNAELTQCETKQNKAAGFSCEDEGSHLTLAACASDFDAQVLCLGTFVYGFIHSFVYSGSLLIAVSSGWSMYAVFVPCNPRKLDPENELFVLCDGGNVI